jgi:hypothetical protein
MIFDTRRPWIKKILENHGHVVDNFDPNNNLLNAGIEIVLVHDSDFRGEYVLNNKKKQTWQQLYSDIFKKRKVVVYSGGEIEGLNSSANLIIVPWEIPYEENSCPATFKEYLISLDEKLLVKRQNAHLLTLSILCQGYLAAHGGIGLKSKIPDELKDVAKKNWNRLKKDWWKPIDFNSIHGEINNLNSDIKVDSEPAKGKIQALISYLKEDAKWDETVLTQKVQNAYNALCALEKSGRGL